MTRRRRFTKGQMVMGLAAHLADAGLDAAIAMNIAMDTLAEMKVPEKWRARLAAEVCDAIDADLRDPKTWTA